MPLDPATASSILHALGLAMQQASMYGPAHNVSRLAMHEAAVELLSSPGADRGFDLACAPSGGGAIVNGTPLAAPDSAGQAFLSRMEAHEAHELRFAPGVSADDVETFLRIFSIRPASIASQGGLKAMLEKNFPTGAVRVLESRWSKVGAGKKPGEGEGDGAKSASHVGTSGAGGTLDLSGVLGGGAFDLSSALADAAPRFGAPAAASAERREKDKSKVAEMLRETADLLDKAGRPPDESVQREVLSTIERMLSFVEEGASGTATRIDSLSREIEADRAMVDSLEMASRRRGMGPQVTRNELLQKLSEITQEVAQPLTVSTGAIDLIRAGKGGDLTEEQRSLLHLAAESMDRMNKLVESLGHIVGLPAGFTPDASLQHLP